MVELYGVAGVLEGRTEEKEMDNIN